MSAATDEHDLFQAVRRLSDPAERAALLSGACGGDGPLRARVEALLAAHDETGNPLDLPPAGCAATSLGGLAGSPDVGTRIGPYALLQKLGEGGMGAVWAAEQHAPVRRRVALKLIKPGMDSALILRRFDAERQALALMDHTNIAKVFDAGTTPAGRPYFAMELVKGVPVTKYCDDLNLSVRERLELFVPVCRAIQHAHTKGVIHRDVKPSNVLVCIQDGGPVPKVIDFGVAKALHQKLAEQTVYTEIGAVVGTLEYMAPEQAELSALDVDTRADVYALGALLYELLTGATPLDKQRLLSAGFVEVQRIIREEEPPRPSTRLTVSGESLPALAAHRRTDPSRLAREVRGDLDWIVMKCLEKDRTRRYESAGGLARDVERHLADEPVEARPPSARYRAGKLVRRHKARFAAAAAAAALSLLGVAGLAASNVLIALERDEKIDALKAATLSERAATLSEKAANEQRRLAQANLADALAAVDRMLTRVSQDRLQFVPQAEAIRRDLLRDALAFYQRFLNRRGDDPVLRRETALAHRRAAFLYYQLGEYDAAANSFETAFAMFDALDAEAPLDDGLARDVVFAHIEHSLVLNNQRRQPERVRALRDAVTGAEALVRRDPGGPAADQLANASNRLAEAIASERPAEAEEVLRRNLTLTAASRDTWLRGQTWLTLANVLARRGRHGEAMPAGREAARLFSQAASESPQLPWVEIGIVEAHERLARSLVAQDRPAEADESYLVATAILDRLAAQYPVGPHYRWGQADLRFKRAPLLAELGRTAEAEQAYRQSVELSERLADDFPDLPGYRWTAVDRRRRLAMFLAGLGRAPEAMRVLEAGAGYVEKLDPADQAKLIAMRDSFFGGAVARDVAERTLGTLGKPVEAPRPPGGSK